VSSVPSDIQRKPALKERKKKERRTKACNKRNERENHSQRKHGLKERKREPHDQR